MFFSREGKITGRENYNVSRKLNEKDEELLEMFIKQYYSGTAYIPSVIYIQKQIEDYEAIQNWLTEINSRKVRIIVPVKGEKKNLLNMVKYNAMDKLRKNIEFMRKKEDNDKKLLEKFREITSLQK